MKPPIGRCILGCFLTLLIVTAGEDEFDENVTTVLPEIASGKVANAEGPPLVDKLKHLDIKDEQQEIIEHEIVVIPGNTIPAPAPSPPPQIIQPRPPPPPPPQYHHPQPAYYPYPYPQPYYPPPMAYYPPPQQIYYQTGPVKPLMVSAVQTIPAVTVESDSSSSSHVKPTELLHQSTEYLWNLIDQKNNEFWSLFDKKQQSGDKGESNVQEYVVQQNAAPSYSSGGTYISESYGGGSSGGGSSWFNKGKTLDSKNCKNE